MSRIRLHEQEVAYKFYISDLLFYQAKGQTLTQKYRELAFDRRKKDTRTADEIAADIFARAGLHVGKEEEA